VVSAWEAWAGDPAIRHRGSSGGVLSALAAWLTETGEVSRFVGATADPETPRRTVSVTITDRETALAAAGSRYAPVSILAAPDALEPGTGLIAKPCESSAARGLLDSSLPAGADRPLLLSFFCAGTPSQLATDRLVTDLGLPPDTPLRRLWYRGRGWPGRFTAEATDGRRVSASYDDSWGKALGPAVQWRCKICPDGVGESSDISAADFWHTDERGYPDFTEGDGCSAVLARTPRGQQILDRAFAEGVLIGRQIDPDRLAAVQPLQVSRRTTLIGRLIGSTIAGRPTPRYRSFGLLRLGLSDWRQTVRMGRGTYRRVRQGRR
jgi:coenzyme F420 hydrogenase subunit beta